MMLLVRVDRKGKDNDKHEKSDAHVYRLGHNFYSYVIFLVHFIS